MILGTLLFLPSMGAGEIILIMFVLLLLFGAKKIPDLARGLGQGIREFKDASSGIRNEVERSINEKPQKEDNN